MPDPFDHAAFDHALQGQPLQRELQAREVARGQAAMAVLQPQKHIPGPPRLTADRSQDVGDADGNAAASLGLGCSRLSARVAAT